MDYMSSISEDDMSSTTINFGHLCLLKNRFFRYLDPKTLIFNLFFFLKISKKHHMNLNDPFYTISKYYLVSLNIKNQTKYKKYFHYLIWFCIKIRYPNYFNWIPLFKANLSTLILTFIITVIWLIRNFITSLAFHRLSLSKSRDWNIIKIKFKIKI